MGRNVALHHLFLSNLTTASGHGFAEGPVGGIAGGLRGLNRP